MTTIATHSNIRLKVVGNCEAVTVFGLDNHLESVCEQRKFKVSTEHLWRARINLPNWSFFITSRYFCSIELPMPYSRLHTDCSESSLLFGSEYVADWTNDAVSWMSGIKSAKPSSSLPSKLILSSKLRCVCPFRFDFLLILLRRSSLIYDSMCNFKFFTHFNRLA